MDVASSIATVAGVVITALALGAFAIVYFRSSLVKETLQVREQNQAALEDRITILENSDAEKTHRIADLEMEIKTLKTLPLEQLAHSYDLLTRTAAMIHETQREILALLEPREKTVETKTTIKRP